MVADQFAIPTQMTSEKPGCRMKENEITAKSRQSIPEIIPTPNVHQFVPKNAQELWSLQARKELVRHHNYGVPPTGSGRGQKALDQPQFTPRSLHTHADRVEERRK